jgi:hypothetical protein
MITGTTLKNGTLKLILTGSDEIDQAVLKQLNGATCRVITDNLRLGDKNIAGGLIIETEKKDDTTRTAGELVPDSQEAI